MSKPKLNYTALPFQSEGSTFLYRKKYVLLADEQGLGKTFQSIAVLAHERSPTLVVCPAILRENWREELMAAANMKSSVIESSKQLEHTRARIFIVSYAMFATLEPNPFFKAVIFDESHNIKNWDAKRTKAAYNFILKSRPKYCFALSGTPIENAIVELYSILKILSLCPTNSNGLKLKEKSQYAFGAKYSYPVTKEGRQGWEGMRNVDQLKDLLKGKYLRRTAAQKLNLPSLRFKEVKTDIFDTKLDRSLSEAYTIWNSSASVGEERSHITQVKVDAAMFKVPFCFEYCKLLLQDTEQLLIYSDHVTPVEALRDYFKAFKVTTAVVTGRVRPAERNEAIERFKSGKARVFIATYGAAATGLNFTHCNNVVFNDYGWKPSLMDQACKRVHRLKQTKPCLVHSIYFGEFDKMIQKKIRQKMKIIKAVL